MPTIIFSSNGKDPYIEDPVTIWLLHYNLVKNNFASIYSLLFNEFRKERLEFNREHLIGFIKRKCEEKKFPFNENTVRKDISVFFRTYLNQKKVSNDIEENFSGLLVDCELVEEIMRAGEKIFSNSFPQSSNNGNKYKFLKIIGDYQPILDSFRSAIKSDRDSSEVLEEIQNSLCLPKHFFKIKDYRAFWAKNHF